jgi:16S rRNA (guanine(966)-N(2))-methyltransferase RsmD
MSPKRKGPSRDKHASPVDGAVVGLRIIGGTLRGRKLTYSGDLRTRPMKDRVRESVFNLVGPVVTGSIAIDLFAGTGALGIEAISRGATKAIFIERHLPTTKLIERNAAALGVADRAEAVFGDAFHWSAGYLAPADQHLTVFCSPPYDFYVERREPMLELISTWLKRTAINGGRVVVEADERFDMRSLPEPDEWDVRTYAPAIVAIR